MRSARRVLLSALLLAGYGAAVALAQGSAPCPPEGDATKGKIQRYNAKGTRTDEATDDDIDDTADISALIAPGDDTLRWEADTAVEVTAFLLDVRDGGPTSANCHSGNPANYDTILDLSPNPNTSDYSHRIIAVITPQWRRIAAKNGADWSTRAIRARYAQRTITIRGWLLFNPEVAARSVNTAPLAGIGITRATAWEIHPVTSIELNDDPLDQQTSLAVVPGAFPAR